LIAGAGGDELFELHRIEPGELPEVSAKAAGVEVVFTIDPKQVGARLVEHSRGDDKAAELFTRTARRGFPQIAGKLLDFIFVQVGSWV
jgi:hypothetical protein